MQKAKETNKGQWIIGLFLTVLFVTALIWLSLESVYGGDEVSDMTRKIYIVCGAMVLLILFLVFCFRAEKAQTKKFEKKTQTELGLRPISKRELFTRHVNKDRFYGPMEWPRGILGPEHRFHGKYKGYEICIMDPFPPPHAYWWELSRHPWTPAVHIKSNSFHFPKFLISKKVIGKFFIKGDQKAQMRFDKPHILDFFNKSRKLAARGNGNEFIFHVIEGKKVKYELLIEQAFIVLGLLSKAAPFSSVSKIGKLQEKCQRDHKRKYLEWLCFLIVTVIMMIFVFPLVHK